MSKCGTQGCLHFDCSSPPWKGREWNVLRVDLRREIPRERDLRREILEKRGRNLLGEIVEEREISGERSLKRERSQERDRGRDRDLRREIVEEIEISRSREKKNISHPGPHAKISGPSQGILKIH